MLKTNNSANNSIDSINYGLFEGPSAFSIIQCYFVLSPILFFTYFEWPSAFSIIQCYFALLSIPFFTAFVPLKTIE